MTRISTRQKEKVALARVLGVVESSGTANCQKSGVLGNTRNKLYTQDDQTSKTGHLNYAVLGNNK